MLPFRKQGQSGTLASIISQVNIQDRSRGRLVQLGDGTIHGPCGRQLELLKGAENTRQASMSSGPRVQVAFSIARAQKALEEQLRAHMPRVLQGHIRWILQAERVGWENQTPIQAQHR